MVFTNVDHTIKLLREETFGPVVGVMQYKTINEALQLVNDSNPGISASVWSKNRKIAERIGHKLETGVITINDHLMSHGLVKTPWRGF